MLLNYKELHNWPEDSDDAIKIQEDLSKLIITESRFDRLEYITAVDTAFNDNLNRLYAAAVTIKLPELTDIERAVAEMPAVFPYIPTLLSFREGPVIVKALSRLKIAPDLVIFAGHGIAHPRSFGLASHLGLLFDKPSIGCARKCLSGEYKEPPMEKGAYSILYINNIECGFVYRSRTNVKPMFISPGHRCSLEDSFRIIGDCQGDYRMPHPLRLAHMYANKYRRSAERRQQANKGNRKNRNNIKKALSR